jgi:anti-anti-sigma regulatory factor
MKVKIDTREKMYVITIHEPDLAANMTEEMDNCLKPLLKGNVKNVVISMSDIKTIDSAAANRLVALQNLFRENNASFVSCNLDKDLRASLNEYGVLEKLNSTPTLSEAGDIVLMEEMEREFGEI